MGALFVITLVALGFAMFFSIRALDVARYEKWEYERMKAHRAMQDRLR